MYSYGHGHGHLSKWDEEEEKDGCQCCGWCITVLISIFIAICLLTGAILTGIGYTNTNMTDEFYDAHRISGPVLLGIGFLALVLAILLCFCVVKPSCCFEPVPIRIVHQDPRRYNNRQYINAHNNWGVNNMIPEGHRPRPSPRPSPRPVSHHRALPPPQNTDYEYDIVSGHQSLPGDVVNNIKRGQFRQNGTALTSHSGYSIGQGSTPRSVNGIHMY